MSDTTTQSNGVTSQYAAQVAADLERNLKEQERLAGELAVLQGQLTELEKDRSVLLNVQQALGVELASAAPAAEPITAVPAPRKKTSASTGAAKATKAKQTKVPQAKTQQPKAKQAAPADRKSSAGKGKPAAADAKPAQPSLVTLVREHLVGQNEPRSAAEVAQFLGQQHPERGIKATVVRTTLEGLVAKNHAHRTKQGTSVFYTSPAAPPAEDEKQDQSS